MTTTSPEPGGPDFPKAPPPPDPNPASAYRGEGHVNPGQPAGRPTAFDHAQTRVPHYGPAQGAQSLWPHNQGAQCPSPYWGLSITSLFFSLFVLFIPGVVAMVYSAQVQQKWDRGDADGAARASKNAQIWGIVGIVVGGIVLLGYLSSGGGAV
jgi:hypothetical protein